MQRATASANVPPSAPKTSQRAQIANDGSILSRAAVAAAILPTASSIGMQRRPADVPDFFDGIRNIDGVAETGVTVYEDRQGRPCRNVPNVIGDLTQADDSVVGEAVKERGCLGAGDEKGLESDHLRHPCIKGAEPPGHHRHLRTSEDFTELQSLRAGLVYEFRQAQHPPSRHAARIDTVWAYGVRSRRGGTCSTL